MSCCNDHSQVGPRVNAFVEGVNVSLIAFGSSETDKTELLQGDTTSGRSAGLVGMVIDASFAALQEKSKTMGGGGARGGRGLGSVRGSR